jgi:hypothetical protein
MIPVMKYSHLLAEHNPIMLLVISTFYLSRLIHHWLYTHLIHIDRCLSMLKYISSLHLYVVCNPRSILRVGY